MASAELRVELVWSPGPGLLELRPLVLPGGSCVVDALQHLPPEVDASAVGIWGHKVQPEDVLQEGDRLEVYRPLTVDPMEARRRRHAVQGGGRRIVSRHRPAPRG